MRRTVTNDVISFRVGTAQELPRIIGELGHDPLPIFEAVGLQPELFDSAENRIAADKLGQLLAVAACRTGRPDLGLLIGAGFRPKRLGLVGLLAAEGPDVRTALRNLVRLLHHNTHAAYLTMTVTGQDVILRYELREPVFEGASIILDAVMVIAMRLLQALCGKEWRPEEVHFSRRAPQDPAPYRQLFQVPLRFNADQDALVFSSDWLDHPVAHPDRHDGKIMFDADSRSLSETVRQVVCSRLGLDSVTAIALAQEIGLSRRSLDRQLAAEGTQCQDLVDAVRFARAKRLLAGGDASLSEVAFALGYQDSSGFSRAFRRWAGVPPRVWRAQHAS